MFKLREELEFENQTMAKYERENEQAEKEISLLKF